MFVFAIVSFLFFSEYQFAVDIVQGYREFTLSRSKVMSRVSTGSTAPKAESSDFCCVGKVWRTSRTNMVAGDCAKSSTKL
jgi:hypothetical protein